MIRYPHIASRVFNTPLLIHPGKLDAIIAALAPRFGMGDIPVAPEAYATATGEKRAPGYSVAGGIAVLDIFGVLVHRSRMEADSTWLLGYNDIARRFEAALADPDVRAIVLNMDSPGGEVAGCFDLAEQIRSARGRKPLHAAVSDLACSGCYSLASACEGARSGQPPGTGSAL